MPTVAFDEFRQDEGVMADVVKAKEMVTEGKKKSANLMEVTKSIWGTLYADDAGIVSRPQWSLVKLISIIV